MTKPSTEQAREEAIQKIRKTLAHVLSDEQVFKSSAKISFQQFDVDKDKLLDLAETQAFCSRLCSNLTVPPIGESTLRVIFEKYTSKNRNGLSINDFARMYKALLLRIRSKYYPPRIEEIRSTLWVPMSPLGRSVDIREHIQFTKRLGSGAFGEVYLVNDLRTSEIRACKIINKARLQLPVEQEEIKILKSVDHPNVIKIFEIFEDPNSVYILQELCEGGELLSTMMIDDGRAQIHDENFVRKIMNEMFDGLSHIHAKKIMHKDLKPENILFATKAPRSPVKIIDFGLGEIFRGDVVATQRLRGSAIYMAPEAFKDGVLCLKSDVWSCGCIMFNLLTGSFPFDAPDLKAFRAVMLSKEVDLEKTMGHVSAQARSLLGLIFRKNPLDRISASEALNHPWFQEDQVMSAQNLSKSMCVNLKLYAKQSGLRNVFINLMAYQLPISNEKVNKISEVFKRLDQDKSGTLSVDNLQNALAEAGFQSWDINLIIQQLDVRNEGRISYTEFLAACYSWRESELNLVWAAFKRLTQFGSNEVSRGELKNILVKGATDRADGSESSLFTANDEAIFDAMFDEVDRDKDGLICWTDFEAFIRGKG